MHLDRFNRPFVRACGVLLVPAALTLAGCDGLSGDDGGDVTVRGQVTNDAGFGKTAAAIEGAVVTAARIDGDGTRAQLEGEAVTDAEGRYRLELEGASDVVVATAEKGTFRARTLVYTSGRSTVDAAPMTVETTAEADVYVEVKRGGEADDVTAAEVALFVSETLAAEVASGEVTAAEVAATLRAAVEAEAAFVREEAGDRATGDAQEAALDAFAALQAGLSAATTTSAQADALQAFEAALVDAYASAGVGAAVQARARQAAWASLARFGAGLSSRARFALQQRAAVVSALATAEAIEAAFDAAGASSARLSALSQARGTLLTRLRAATSTSALATAQAEYATRVEVELASQLSVSAATLLAASAAAEAARSALDVALAGAGSGSAVAEAYAAFYTSAEAAVRQHLEATGEATFGASVLSTLNAR